MVDGGGGEACREWGVGGRGVRGGGGEVLGMDMRLLLRN